MSVSRVNQLPPDIQERLARLQQLQSTLQSLVLQRQRLDLEQRETERALKTLEGVPSETKVYKSAGAILVERDKDEVVSELSDRKEFLEMRSKVLSKQEDKTRERLNSLQKRLQKEPKWTMRRTTSSSRRRGFPRTPPSSASRPSA
jgi:prefoldin beta subunit